MFETLPEKVTLSPDVLCQEVDGEMVLLDLKSETYFGLDATGARFWQLFQDTGSVQQAFKSVLSEFDVNADTLHLDMLSLLNDLSEAGLISVQHGSTQSR